MLIIIQLRFYFSHVAKQSFKTENSFLLKDSRCHPSYFFARTHNATRSRILGTRSFDQITFFQNSFFSLEFCSFEFFLFCTFFRIRLLSKLSIFERTLIDQTDWTIYKIKNVRLIVLSKIFLFVCSKNIKNLTKPNLT